MIKKSLCITLALVMVMLMTFAALPVGAETSDIAETGASTLTVTVNGKNPVQVEVGNEFLMFVGLYSGPEKILDGQVRMDYDTNNVSFVHYAVSPKAGEEPEEEFYSFPSSLYKTGVVMNSATPGSVNYNFTKAKGIDAFTDSSKLFSRFRFKATAAGKTDISFIIQYMIDANENRIYYKGVASTSVKPYTTITIEPSKGCVGDADKDGEVTILDATYMQRVAAGENLTADTIRADVTGDKAVSLKDAVVVRKYLANKTVSANIGEWIFASEQ